MGEYSEAIVDAPPNVAWEVLQVSIRILKSLWSRKLSDISTPLYIGKKDDVYSYSRSEIKTGQNYP